MYRHMLAASALVVGVSLGGGPLSANEAAPHVAAAKGLPVGTCINLGNTLEPETEGAWGGAPATKADFDRIAGAGFDTVRIPVRWHNKSSNTPPYTVDPQWMDRVQQIEDWAL